MSRLDVYLTETGMEKSRSRAAALIKEGKVSVNGIVRTKPSWECCPEDRVEITGQVLQYVGRGGLKLEKAMDAFNVSAEGKICLDIGASTGGFTDVLLKRGAEKVYAVDVGHDQLAPELREDRRVVSMEGLNIKDALPEMFPEKPSLCVMDVSFISLTQVLPHALRLASPGAGFISLIKPQFEAGRQALGKNGIVRSDKDRAKAIDNVLKSAASLGLGLRGLIPSPIRGGDGNSEYLAFFISGAESMPVNTKLIVETKSFPEEI